MSKVLFIHGTEFNAGSYGGSIVSNRNLNALHNYVGKDNVDIFSLVDKSNFVKKIIDRLHFRFSYLRRWHEKEILKIVNNYSLVFIDQSCYGKIAKLIKCKNRNIKIISFFHNIEFEYAKQEKKSFVKLAICKIAFKNEQWACIYSDAVIVMNNRDKNLVEKFYRRKVDAVIPVSFPNIQIEFNKNKIGNPPTALFLGSNFFANIHGIKWFIKNVLPYVNIRLQIIGKNMNMANLTKDEKLHILGYVEKLDEYIQNADFMIFPILDGSGMKVKTCEALMHGKNIIGTSEAFMGYDVDFEKIGAKCETANEFIKAMNEFLKRFSSKYNDYSRNIFLEKYTDKIVFEQFAEVFKRI
jgi:hypothetical protein